MSSPSASTPPHPLPSRLHASRPPRLHASTSSHASIKSALTLASLEDSGWYQVDYTKSEPLIWGRGEGCAFATEACITSSRTLHGFCNTAGATACTADYKAKGNCAMSTYSSALPTAYQYFSNTAQGGSLAQTDYCPYYQAYSNGDCDDTANAPSGTNYYAQAYGTGGMCFDSTLLYNGYVYSSTARQACHKTRCTSGQLELSLTKSDGSIEWVTCTSNGAAITPPSSAGLQGSITCPATSTLLCNPSSCSGLACDGTSDCNAGVCTCGTAFGTTCGGTDPPSPPPAPPPSATFASQCSDTASAGWQCVCCLKRDCAYMTTMPSMCETKQCCNPIGAVAQPCCEDQL